MTSFRFMCCIVRMLLLAMLLACGVPALAETGPRSIRVVMDDNYPPFVFRNSDGTLQGILIDQWRLWEQKSGIRAELSAMDWGSALSAMKAGKFDVIDTIFKTEERSGWLDFTSPYAKIEVPVFFDKEISGITDAASLKGFVVAVKSGDAAIDLLKRSGVDNLMFFSSYEAIIQAAKDHKVTIFVVDRPPALYFLHKFGIQEKFKQTAALHVGELHRAVARGNSELLKEIEDGFARISARDLNKIDEKWYGSPLLTGLSMRTIFFAAGSLGLLVLALFLWNRILRKAVTSRTAELKASEERYRAIYEQAADGILLGSPEGVITGANMRMESIAGGNREELIGRHVSTIFSPEALEKAPLRFDLLQQGKTVINQRDLVRADGSMITVEMYTSMMSDGTYQSIYHDISERKIAEYALRQNEDLLRRIIEQGPISMAIVRMDGIIEFINRRAIDTFGYLPEDIPDMDSWWVRAYPDESYRAEVIARWMGLVGQAIAQNREIERREYWVTCRDGSLKTVIIFGVPVAGRVFVIFEDITERKRAEEERLNLERQLLHAQKLESLGVLSGGIAHDFNNLLLAVLGNLDLALMKLPGDSNVRKYIEQAVNASRHAARLTNMMLAYSGKGSFIIKELNLNELLEENATMLATAISRAVTLDLRLDHALPPIMADAGQIQQVVMNLITNASEAIGDGNGSITLATGVQWFDQAVLNSSRLEEKLAAGHFVMMEVCDTGSGMDEETLQKLFDPFFTTKFTGRGLGMSAVLGIMRAHKGAFLVDSRPGAGTTIKVLFPIAALPQKEQAAGPLSVKEVALPARGRRPAILIVDDEEMIRSVSVAMIEALGFETFAAADGEEALRIFREQGGRIGMVLLDQVMPGMDGVAVFTELRRIRPDIRVLLASGFSQQEVSDRYMGLGLDGYIQKPFNIAMLADEVQRILGVSEEHASL